ncbi:MAG: ribosomal-protein-alanine N-acetyltransferase [Salinisphaeraceae bacterium]|jgi:ribosomal-protein-alanine N-acetyltransferase|nr:ribosomal-protein-alanine N-acetyltransferase [Salinisphaeraceae bacterium]
MSASPEAAFQVRRLVTEDVPAVLEIERQSYQYPWSEGIFRDCLRVGYRCFVATDLYGHVRGYSLLSVAVGEAHILNLCVHPDYRRLSIARLLLDQLVRQAVSENAESVMLEVRPSNKGAIRLYEGYGFKRIGRRKNYYPAASGREDALLLAYFLH